VIKWAPCKSDGGSPIQKYVIEKKKKGGDWEKVIAQFSKLTFLLSLA